MSSLFLRLTYGLLVAGDTCGILMEVFGHRLMEQVYGVVIPYKQFQLHRQTMYGLWVGGTMFGDTQCRKIYLNVMLIVFTGNGKGKTTASLGQAVRAVGRGKKVLMIQFVKGPWKSGEDFIDIVGKGDKRGSFELKKMGLGFVGILGDQLPKEEHSKAAKEALSYFKSELPKKDVLILDEVNVAVSLGLLTDKEVLEAVKDLPLEKIVLFTGRGAPGSFIERADLVTEMKEIKHPFNKGEFGKVVAEF
jgi:cob(I)alamin adenosyltransferase